MEAESKLAARSKHAAAVEAALKSVEAGLDEQRKAAMAAEALAADRQAQITELKVSARARIVFFFQRGLAQMKTKAPMVYE